ncbi:uncharacterized protein LOC127616771 [Scomber scombrus]|uniref:Uncharacterized protein LOC127616771 n=1 Tax=Scomber scombrus TaxID=13677 RepID=A0AAV1MTH5_SCOSC
MIHLTRNYSNDIGMSFGLDKCVYRNICNEYGLEVLRSEWKTPPKVAEKNRAKILWDFPIHTGKLVMANQPDILLMDKQQKKAVVIDVVIPSDNSIRKKEQEKLGKYQGLKEELEKMWGVEVTVVPEVIGALGAVTHKQGEWIQQIQGQYFSVSQRTERDPTLKVILRTPETSHVT